VVELFICFLFSVQHVLANKKGQTLFMFWQMT